MVAEEILALFPIHHRKLLKTLIDEKWPHLEEIRIRINRPLELISHNRFDLLDHVIFTEADGEFLLNQLSEFSRYRYQQELKEGFITLVGGHRVGLAGRAIVHAGAITQIQSISSFNIRIANEQIGSAAKLMPFIYKEGHYLNTLIIGPPQSGKTTLLRDIARLMGNGWAHVPAVKVGLIDERSEIAGCHNGLAHYQVGIRTDIMDSCPKVDGMMMMIRSMSPHVIIVDEIGSVQDVQAIQEVTKAGVNLVCTAHSYSYQELSKRRSFQTILNDQHFDRFLILNRDRSCTPTILDSNGHIVEKEWVKKNELDWSNALNSGHYVNRL
ncbi:stage III sporulation protein AA [Amphibacillus sediminis]|uniref:stage III sporulation protein AA n=1 Tax=Amphibacillus sediminis TaxID=360185 RepID=UPI00082F9E2E|nr:stage III sporulation protein AA [Amphibacillus sediminis]